MNHRSMKRLKDTDARALDVLLDQSVSGGITREPAVSARDLAGASQALELLAMMPVVEPSMGLADRVMRAVDAGASRSILSDFNYAAPALHA